MPVDLENFLIKIRTLSTGKVDETHSFRTRGDLGAFRITVNPLDRGERSENVLQLTGWVRSNGLLEIRVGLANSETNKEIGEQMIVETVRLLDPGWEEGFDLDFSRNKRNTTNIKKKPKPTRTSKKKML